ncbi:MAG TPA: hypothetical protein ENJ91_07060 [Rhodobacteraceae bacterium]|nr:hypothetical protein [Paracoccaceae bacterium]
MPPIEQFHPMILHFPIVLIMILAVHDLFGLWRGLPLGGRGTYATVATAIAIAAGGTALIAASLGDVAVDVALQNGVSEALVETHEDLGSAAAALFGLWAALRAFVWWRPIEISGGKATLLALIDIGLVLLIIVVAYFGGQLVYEHGVNVSTGM